MSALTSGDQPLLWASRLEDWLERDISILAPNLLVIGRQVETAFGGMIDLLCMNELGDLEIVKLKRRKTPRRLEVTHSPPTPFRAGVRFAGHPVFRLGLAPASLVRHLRTIH